jgi:uncharacterized OsmC-like protein
MKSRISSLASSNPIIGGSSLRKQGITCRFVSSGASQSPSGSSATKSHKKHYKIKGSTSIASKSGVVLTTDTGHTLQTDVPIKMGGKNTAAQPVESLLAALIGCTQATALFVGRNLTPRIVIERMEFDIDAVRDERGSLNLPIEVEPPVPSRLERVSGQVRVFASKDEAISEDSIHILKEQTEIRCPVANMMLASGCVMDVDWIDGSANG